MDPGYENVMDTATLVQTVLALGIHGAVATLQAALAVYLVATGAQTLAAWTGRIRVLLGIGLLLPLLLGVPFVIPLLAILAAGALLLFVQKEGGLLRRAAIAGLAIVAVFMLWERDDPLDLGVEVITTMAKWRADELDWQQTNDVKAPKVGDLAPDFELQDPSGASAVRLSDFRGKRPVALIFGSYT